MSTFWEFLKRMAQTPRYYSYEQDRTVFDDPYIDQIFDPRIPEELKIFDEELFYELRNADD